MIMKIGSGEKMEEMLTETKKRKLSKKDDKFFMIIKYY